MAKNPLADAGDTRDEGSIPGSGRSPGEGYGNALQYSCLENPMDGGAWWTTIHGVTELYMTEVTAHMHILHVCTRNPAGSGTFQSQHKAAVSQSVGYSHS